MDDIFISLQRSGGWAPVVQAAEVDLAAMPSAEAKEWKKCVQAIDFDDLPAADAAADAATRDGTCFNLEVRLGKKRHVFEFGDRSIPPPLRELVTAMSRRLKAARLK